MERLESLLRTAFPDARELAVTDRTGTGDPPGALRRLRLADHSAGLHPRRADRRRRYHGGARRVRRAGAEARRRARTRLPKRPRGEDGRARLAGRRLATLAPVALEPFPRLRERGALLVGIARVTAVLGEQLGATDRDELVLAHARADALGPEPDLRARRRE